MAEPVLRYPGAKWSMADWIVSMLPSHDVYLEPFFGSGAVFFNKQPSRLETINDINGDVINLFKILRDYPEELERRIELTPWAREEYYTCTNRDGSVVKTDNEIEMARRFLVRCWQSMSGKLDSRTGWRHDIKCDCGQNHVKTWLRLPQRIRSFAGRLKDAQIENRDALELIERYRLSNVLIYVDPPYVLSTRAGKIYHDEMTDKQHVELLDILNKHPGPVLLSGYDSEIYSECLSKWERKSKSSVADQGKKRQEVIWINPVASNSLGTLFNGVI